MVRDTVIKPGSMHPSDIIDPNTCFLDFIGGPANSCGELNPESPNKYSHELRSAIVRRPTFRGLNHKPLIITAHDKY